MSPLVIWLLVSFAGWRLAHLVSRDTFPPTVRLRRRAMRKPTGWWALLITCPLCVSAYSTAAVLGGLAAAGYDLPAPALLWLAGWGGASFVALAVE